MTRGSLFSLGRLVATPTALRELDRVSEHAGVLLADLLSRHARGDWGDLGPGDRAANDSALECDARIFSAYVVAPDVKVWVITEADRSSTCVLLPGDY